MPWPPRPPGSVEVRVRLGVELGDDRPEVDVTIGSRLVDLIEHNDVTPAVSGMPRLSAKVKRSGHARRSKIRMWRNRRYRTSIVASAAITASLTTNVVSSTCSTEICGPCMDLH